MFHDDLKPFAGKDGEHRSMPLFSRGDILGQVLLNSLHCLFAFAFAFALLATPFIFT